ncbi:MAG: hypothetical protein AAF902_09465, partial [Chloroflexota bacterium]
MRRSFIISFLGLVLGLAVGFYLGWVVLPVELIDVAPADLEPTLQDDHLQLIADAYAIEQDIDAAAARIGSLGREDWGPWLLQETVDQILLNPTDIQTVNMVQLARAFGLNSPAFDQVAPEV